MDIEKAMEFLVQQNARTDARLDERIEALTQRIDRVDAQIEALTEGQNRTDGQINLLISVVGQQQGQINALTAARARLTEAQRRTDQGLKSLRRTFEEWLRRGGNGSRPS